MAGSNTIHLLVSAAAGFALGMIHFGGLWLTVSRLNAARRPAITLVLSSAARLVLTLAVFAVMARAGWPVAVAGLAGFIAARLAMVHWSAKER